MSQYQKVIDKYWIEFLDTRNIYYMQEQATHSYFWSWFYNDLCKDSKTLAAQKWQEAQA